MDALEREKLFRRKGRFFIPMSAARRYPEYIMEIMGAVIVVEAKHDFLRDGFEYFALSPMFEELVSHYQEDLLDLRTQGATKQ